jgi:hypothetical protein
LTYAIFLNSARLIKVLALIATAAIVIAWMRPEWTVSRFRRVRSALQTITRHRRNAILTAMLFPLVIRALMLPWFPPPLPQVHDEFSYLLMADTFAHGRISNPTPRFWQHFETEYVLLNPTYASMYEPAQGLVLAAGQVFFGHPWWGVWLSIGMMFGTICWALTFVMPVHWAFWGTFCAGLQFGIFGLWMNSYFGGAPAAMAGALAVASLARMRHTNKQRTSAALCGLAIILTFASRPVEACLWFAIALAFAEIQIRRRPLRDHFRESAARFYSRLLPPFAAVFLCGAGMLAWYNWGVTGSPLDPPYLEYQSIYGTPQPYWWGEPVNVASFDYPEIRDNYLNQKHLFEDRESLTTILQSERNRLRDFWRFFIGPFFTPGLIFIFWIGRDRRIRPWLWASVPFVLDKATWHTWFPAENAPPTVLIVLVATQCWRHFHVSGRRRQIGAAISYQLVAACLLCVILGGAGRAIEPLLSYRLRWMPTFWESLYKPRLLRDDVTAILDKTPGKHLLFVKYSADHCFCEEWVFNAADIRNQRIVYARPYTPNSDTALARYLSDHDVWVVEPDAQPYILARMDDSYLRRRAAKPSQ